MAQYDTRDADILSVDALLRGRLLSAISHTTEVEDERSLIHETAYVTDRQNHIISHRSIQTQLPTAVTDLPCQNRESHHNHLFDRRHMGYDFTDY